MNWRIGRIGNNNILIIHRLSRFKPGEPEFPGQTTNASYKNEKENLIPQDRAVSLPRSGNDPDHPGFRFPDHREYPYQLPAKYCQWN
jgi:hypothetical protein